MLTELENFCFAHIMVMNFPHRIYAETEKIAVHQKIT